MTVMAGAVTAGATTSATPATAPAALLSVRGLSVTFQTEKGVLPVLNGVALEVRAGETVCIVGESGSGKSVTAKSIMRLIGYEKGVITGGSVLLGDSDLVALPPREMQAVRGKRIAMIFQEPMCAFDPVCTVGRQITETIRLHEAVSKQEAYDRAVDLLQKVGISEAPLRMRQYPFELSGGMLQRAMIAMALSCNPDLLIADEPTTALDVTTQAQILRLLKELQEEFRMSIILITHDLGVAATLADKIFVMYTSRIVERAGVDEIFDRPLHPYTQGLLRSIATSDCNRAERLHSIEGVIPALWELPQGCHFHPRCPHALERCRQQAPPLTSVSEEHQVACWMIGEAAPSLSIPPAVRPRESVQNGSVSDLESGRPESLFRVENLSKHYSRGKGFSRNRKAPVRAVDDVSFTIGKGEVFGLVGESGSGKSTLGRVLLQLERATSGKVFFEGRDLSEVSSGALREIRRDLQVIFQDPYGSMNPRWRVSQIIGEPLDAHEHLTAREKRERLGELLEMVGLDSRLHDQYPYQFSGGQRQRIAIARAIALRPKFILADEAVSALDVSVQAQIVNLLKELQQQLDLTYLFIAHSLDLVRYLADRLGVMYLGEMIEIAGSDELFSHPAHHYTRALIASSPTPRSGSKTIPPAIVGEIPSPANPPSGCRFHTRCPAATARCLEEKPQLVEVSTDHWLACHYP
jgi:peptide/nickel transport system ATP-binding protein